MNQTPPTAWRWIALVLAFGLAGCTDFAQYGVGGVRRSENVAQGPPKPAPQLFIPNPPTTARAPQEDAVKQASHVHERELQPSPIDANFLMNQQALHMLQQRGAGVRLAGMGSYRFRLRRRESIDGKKTPEEIIQVAIRREPFAVHLKWLGPEGKGRETIYVKGKYKNEMQIRLAANDAFPLPAGFRWSIAPDDPKARARSRYPITDAGLISLAERFGKILTALESGDPREGTMKYLGQVDREEFDAKVEAVLQVLPAKSDPNLPKGGQRWWYFDVSSGLPVLVIAHDADGEVEFYCHDHIQAIRLGDDDFNPEKLWKK